MTTATISATWPTEESLKPVEDALAAAFNETERLLWDLTKLIKPWMDEGICPDPLPTTATIGTLYSFHDTLRSEIDSIREHANSLESYMRDIDTMRLAAKAEARRDARDA